MYLFSIDPGVSTGMALLSYTEDTFPVLEEAWQFPGGVSNLVEHLQGVGLGVFNGGTVIAEKFTARNTQGFSYTTSSLEPLRGEGALIALGVMPDYDPKDPRWRDPKMQYLVGGKDLADKKKRQHRFLKDVGMYRTNKDFPLSPAKDLADDFRSACAHALSYLARTGHKPTFDRIADWIENE